MIINLGTRLLISFIIAWSWFTLNATFSFIVERKQLHAINCTQKPSVLDSWKVLCFDILYTVLPFFLEVWPSVYSAFLNYLMLHYFGIYLADDFYIQTSFTTRTVHQEQPGIKCLCQELNHLTVPFGVWSSNLWFTRLDLQGV